MATRTIRVRGVAEVVAALERHGANVEAALETITQAAASVVRERAAVNAGGDLGASMVQETTERKPRRVVVAVGPHKDRWYAKFREFGAKAHPIRAIRAKVLKIEGRFVAGSVGHPGVSADPFLRPAADEAGGAARDAAAGEMRKLLG